MSCLVVDLTAKIGALVRTGCAAAADTPLNARLMRETEV